MTILDCSRQLRAAVLADKFVTLLLLLLFVLLFGLELSCNRTSVYPVKRRACTMVLFVCTLGALHALFMVLELPSTLTSHAAWFWLLELTFSIYNALLVTTLGLLNCVWVDVFHAAAYPHATALRAACSESVCRMAWMLLVAPVGIALAADAAAVLNLVDTEADIKIQHTGNVLLCGAASIRSLWLLCGLAYNVTANSEAPALLPSAPSNGPSNGLDTTVHHRRQSATLVLLCSVWVCCATFCATILIASFVHNMREASIKNKPSIVQYSFLVYDMGAIFVAKLAYVMTVAPSLIDKAFCLGLCCFQSSCCTQVLHSYKPISLDGDQQSDTHARATMEVSTL